MFRVTFDIRQKTYEILAKTVDVTSHPFLVYISDLEFEDRSSLVVSPNGNESRKRFGDVDKLAVPVQSLRLLEEIPDKETRVSSLKVASKQTD